MKKLLIWYFYTFFRDFGFITLKLFWKVINFNVFKTQTYFLKTSNQLLQEISITGTIV
jgi:hypothetical protein